MYHVCPQPNSSDMNKPTSSKHPSKKVIRGPFPNIHLHGCLQRYQFFSQILFYLTMFSLLIKQAVLKTFR